MLTKLGYKITKCCNKGYNEIIYVKRLTTSGCLLKIKTLIIELTKDYDTTESTIYSTTTNKRTQIGHVLLLQSFSISFSRLFHQN